MIGILGSMTGVAYQRYVIDLAMMFGLFFIVTLALNLQYGNAGVPNLACALSASVGGYVVSAIITRLVLWIGLQAGLDILPWASNRDWMRNNCVNISTMNDYLQSHALLGVAMLLFSLALGFFAGWALGYVISLPAIRLKPTYLIIALIMMEDASRLLGRKIVKISGGTGGMFVPNVLAWYPGDRTIPNAVVTLTIGVVCYFTLRTMLNSPSGRLMRAVRENGLTVNSVGKDATAIRRNVLMFGSGITALAGVLLSQYYCYMVHTSISTLPWTYWPWLMLMIGGPGNSAGTWIGCALVIAMKQLLIAFRGQLEMSVWYPIVIFEQQLLGLLLLGVLIFRPKGLIMEKPLRIAEINYKRLIGEESANE
jgi:branched-chain amino acid transport system permease protein